MPDKSKRKIKYTRADLFKARMEGKKEIFEELADAVKSGETMSMAEAEYGCSYLGFLNRNNPTFDPLIISICEPCIFVNLYVRYWNDMEGKYAIEKPGTTFEESHVSAAEKKKEVALLDATYHNWEALMTKNTHKGNVILNKTIDETNVWLKKLDKLDIDFRDRPYKIKATKLSAKYVYLTVKEFFEEHGSDVVIVSFNGEEIEIDVDSMIHVLIRHYAGASKQFDMEKSFHLDKQIRWRYLPYDIKAIFERISDSKKTLGNDFSWMPFRFNGELYTARTEQKSKNEKGKVRRIHRLGTFYPIELPSELDALKKDHTEIKIDQELSVFQIK